MNDLNRRWRALDLRLRVLIVVGVAVCAPIFIAGAIDGARQAATPAAHTTATAVIASTSAAHPSPAVSYRAAPAVSKEARMLADLDGGAHPASRYEHALDALAPHCTESHYRLAAVTNATLEDLQKNGVTDESELSVLQHLKTSVPSTAGRTNCTSVAAAYATLREGS